MGALIAASAVLLCISVILVVLLSRNQAQATTDSGYSETPKNQTVAQGQTATFRCQHQEAVVGWKVNGTSWTHSSELVGISNEIETVNGRVVSLLHIDGIAEYNSTTVTCDGFFEDGRPNDESVALLWIQGPLNSPDHLTRTSFNNITWKAPHSLDITDTELDIVYCVDVIDVTCVEEEFLFSDCHVTATYIYSGLLRDGRIYRITVTPRSNVVGSLNGTPIVLEENFTLYRRPYVLDISNDHVNITLQPSDVVGVQPTWNSSLVSLVPIDGVDTSTLQIPITMFHQTKLTLTVVFNDVPENRVFNFSLLADGCSLISQPAVLSTHKIQNISVSSSRPGRIRIAWDFVKSRGPTSNRVLVIVYSTSGDTDRAYYHIGKEIQRGKFFTDIRGLPGDIYYVLLFPFEENGKPFERAATNPISVTVMARPHQNGNGRRKSYSANYTLLQNGVEVGCIFEDHDDPATTCLVIIHKRITRLDNNHQFTIVDSHILERHGNTASRIIDIDLEENQLGFVKVNVVQDHKDSTNGDDHTIPIIVFFVIIFGVAVAVTILVIIIIKWLRQQNCVKTTLFPSLMKNTGRSTESNQYTIIDRMNTSSSSERSDLIKNTNHKESEEKVRVEVVQTNSEDALRKTDEEEGPKSTGCDGQSGSLLANEGVSKQTPFVEDDERNSGSSFSAVKESLTGITKEVSTRVFGGVIGSKDGIVMLDKRSHPNLTVINSAKGVPDVNNDATKSTGALQITDSESVDENLSQFKAIQDSKEVSKDTLGEYVTKVQTKKPTDRTQPHIQARRHVIDDQDTAVTEVSSKMHSNDSEVLPSSRVVTPFSSINECN